MREGVSAGGGLRRAGFWRRTLAYLIDFLGVVIPCSLLAGLLFSLSGGTVQMVSTGLTLTTCQPLAVIPSGLDPPPPEKSTYAVDCRMFSLAGETGRLLSVGRTVIGRGFWKTNSRSYMLGAGGEVVRGTDLSCLVIVLLFGYLIVAQWKAGLTLGLKLVAARLATAGDLAAKGVPLRRLAIRYGVLVAGFIPGVIVLLVVLFASLRASDNVPPSVVGLGLGIFLAAGWSLWNLMLIVWKRDPVYDRVAGTVVVRI